MYGTRSQGISQFYLHTPRSSANGISHTCLCLPSQSWYSFTDPGGWKAELALALAVGRVISLATSIARFYSTLPGHASLRAASGSRLLRSSCRSFMTSRCVMRPTDRAAASSTPGSPQHLTPVTVFTLASQCHCQTTLPLNC